EQDVIDAADHARGLELQQILRLFDDDDLRLVAARVGADGAGVGLGEIEADAAVVDVFLDVADGVDKTEGACLVGLEDVKGDPLGGGRADAGELFEFAGQAAQGLGDVFCHRGRIPNSRPARAPAATVSGSS